MQIKQLKIDHWYQTVKGIGKCLSAGQRCKFELLEPTRIEWLVPKEVQYEIPKDQEPKEETDTEKPSPSTVKPAPSTVKPASVDPPTNHYAFKVALDVIQELADALAADPNHDVGLLSRAEYAKRFLNAAIAKAKGTS